MNIQKLKRHPSVFARLFGISPSQFDVLVEKVGPLWQRAEAKRLRHPRKIKKGSGRLYKLSLEEMIAMLLLYTRSYVTHVFLSALFEVHDSAICRHFERIRPSVIAVFDLPERSVDLSEEEILKVVDATEQRTERRNNGCGYSGKKKAHTVKTQLVVDSRGAIRHISSSVPGNMHDKKLYDQSGIRLPDTAKGDLGYLGTNLSIPFKSSKFHRLSKREADYNARHSRMRIVVEHVFASLKAFRILAERFRGALVHYREYFLIVCGLRNLARS